jgi:hypothetical protein
MKKTQVVAGLLTALVFAVISLVIASTPPARSGGVGVSGGAASKDELIGDFLTALRHKDRDALRRLRVTEDEFRKIIMPGHVEVGQPLRTLQPEAIDYFWSSLATKSAYYEQNLIHHYGGRTFQVLASEFETEPKRYASYTHFKQLRLTLREAGHADQQVELETGSIVEIDGRYKFASFVRD